MYANILPPPLRQACIARHIFVLTHGHSCVLGQCRSCWLGCGRFCLMYVEGQIRPLFFNLMRGQFEWMTAVVIIFFPTPSHMPYFPLFSPVMTAERLTCHGSSHFQESVRSLLHYPALLLLQHHVGKGWYQLVPGEDRGRTGSVRVHRLSGGHLRQRCASAPAPATLPLINGPGPDN